MWGLTAALLGACGDDAESPSDDGGASDGSAQDATTVPGDAARDAGNDAAPGETADAGKDAAADTGPAGDDAGPADAGPTDAGPTDAGPAGPVDPIVAGNDAPTLKAEDVAYLSDGDLGTRILLRGRDPNGDIASVTIHFLNGTNDVAYDLDNSSDTPPTAELTRPIVPTPSEAGFFASFDQTPEFAAAVDTVRIFVTDVGGRMSAPVTVMKKTTPVVSAKCDPQGFNRCSGSSLCAPSGSAFTCLAAATARNNACNAAALLSPPGVTSVRGRLRSVSTWDVPANCSPNNLKSRPDAVVKLQLAADTGKVTLSTNNANTDFDTVLYALTMCSVQPSACETTEGCLCADDVQQSGGTAASTRSVLTLLNLKKGDHYIVVDSFPASENSGDEFELTVTTE